MKIIVADDEEKALEILAAAVKQAEPSAVVSEFRNGKDVLEYAKENKCEIAFLDIRMGEMDGISLAKKLKIINPQINIIFATGYSEYAIDVVNLRVSGYILKPVTAEKVREEIENLRYPIL